VCGRIIQQTSDDDVCDVTEAEKEAADEDAEKKQVAKSGPFTVDESCALVAWFQSTTHGAGWKENCTNKAGGQKADPYTRLTLYRLCKVF